MTDARLPSRWLLDPTYNALSDGAWRTFTRLLMWSVDARTDGVIRLDQLDLIPRARAEHVPELTAAGVADVRAGVLTLNCFASTQTSREQLEAAEAAREAERAADRERKRRDRLHKKGDHSLCDHDDDPAKSESGRKSGRKSDGNPAPKHRKAGRQALTEPPTDRRNDDDQPPKPQPPVETESMSESPSETRPQRDGTGQGSYGSEDQGHGESWPRVIPPGSASGPPPTDDTPNDLGFAVGRVDLGRVSANDWATATATRPTDATGRPVPAGQLSLNCDDCAEPLDPELIDQGMPTCVPCARGDG